MELLKILPQFYNDLLMKKVDTLKHFQVNIHGINIPEPSDLVVKIIYEMCVAAAASIKLQCGREYGFSNREAPRATVLATASREELDGGLSTNTLVAERDFSKFDRLVRVAKSRNRKFTVKGI